METKLTKKLVTSWFAKNADISVRSIEIGQKQVHIFYIDCLVDKMFLSQNVVAKILNLTTANNISLENCLSTNELLKINTKQAIINNILNGFAVVFVESSNLAFSVGVTGYSTRAISEPPTSQVTKGPREGFVEDLSINLSLLRRKIKSPDFSVENLIVGTQTQTKIAVVYLSNIADKGLVKKLTQQLKQINIDGIIDSYYIESLLEEGKLKFVRRIGNSEKPDVVASRLLEGRVAIVVDGSPIVLTAPFMLIEDLQSPEDYYTIPAKATFIRIIRLIGFILGFLLPGIYVALQSYHYKVLPINFLVTLLSSIQGISFPPLIEILFVLFLFDILAEASARMPKLLGMALSIIGALVLGETTVHAGIISPPSIVVVAISSIMLFIVPEQVPQVSLLRIAFTIIGGISGFYGMLMSFIVVTTYLISINGYGVPFLAPYAPNIKQDKQDAIIKRAVNHMHNRPKSLTRRNTTRYVPVEDKYE